MMHLKETNHGGRMKEAPSSAKAARKGRCRQGARAAQRLLAGLQLPLGGDDLPQGQPLLKRPLEVEDIKRRLLGHWGASPALSFVYAHLNRLILKHDLDVIFVAGPGHGAPGVLGPAYLEGTYSEIYPDKSEDEEGLQKFFKQFSFPGHIGSHVTPETPGSIHEGGELGYSLSHAYGMALDNPDLIVACVVGDGEAETGPLATAWHSNKFINPPRTARCCRS
jgi:xylulose-5-phosphate/fructose-6-phosphate phosphoketolase